MQWRKKPASYLRYWTGPVNRDAGFKTVLIYCTGTLDPTRGYHGNCHHIGRLTLADLPDWDWYDISAHLRCSVCGNVGYVVTRVDWDEVIDFSRPKG